MDMVPQIPGRVLLSIGAVFLISSATLFTMALLPIIEDGNENLEFVDWINEKRSIYGAMVEKARGFDHMGNVMTDPGTRGDHEVVIEWIREVLPGVEEPVSTPALHDLDNDGDMEVVVISSGDGVMAFKNDGSFYWPAPFTDCVINVLGESASTSGLDFDPPPFFPSAKVFDGGKENGSMIIVPEKDGVLCLDENGQKMWKGGETTGHYFSTPGFTDLEGLFPSDRGEWEIITASDDENRRGWLEALNIEGGTIFRKELPTGGEGSLIGCGVVTADLDGSFWDGPEPRKPEKDEEVRSEIMIGNHDRGLRILQYDRMVGNNTPEYMERIKGMLAGHQTYTTATAGNVSGGPELEIFVGSAEGYPRCWTGWGGKLYAYTPAGVKLWDYTTGSSGASIFSSPALGDVQMSRYDVDEEIVDYEIVFGADTGYVYMLNTMMHNREWSFNTNGRVMSSPAFCDLNSDDELEVVIGSDSGKVFCFDGDPSDGIDEGVPYPGDGPNRDVLWVYDAGCPIGISSPVVGDIDLDGQQEILIGDIKGRVHCISAGGFTAVGRKDWPEFHGNINNTGFISPEKSQNIDLHSRIGEDGEPEPVSVLADPGEIVYFNLTLSYDSSIERVGTEMIMIRVLNRTVPEGWSCSLDTPDLPGEKDPDHVMMVKNTQRDLLFTVQTPEYREVPETACVMIRAYHSENVNVMDKLQIIIHLNVSTGVEVYFDHPEEIDPTSEHPGSKWIGMHPGSYYDVDVLVRNIGTLDDVFDMELVEPPEEVGWNWSFLDNGLCSRSVELSFPRDGTPIVDTEASCTVRIHCPDDAIAGMKVPVTITATSQKSLHEPFVPVRDSDTFLPVVTQENDLRIDVMVQVLQVLPGEKETAEVRVTNLCNREMIEVHLDGSDLPDGWKVDLPEGNLKVFMGQTRSFMMEIRAPEDAVAFQKVMFTLSGYIIDQTNIRSTNTIPFSVLQFHEIEAGLKDTSTRSVSPGQIIPVQIEVVNLGNGEEIVNMGYDSEGNSIILSFQDRLNRSMDQFKMDGLETTEITAHVKIPADQATGLTRIIIEVHGQEQDIYLILDLQVSLASSVDIFGPTGEREIKIGTAPNKPGEVLVALTNEGNGPDDVNVEISGFHGAPVEKVIALGIICVQGCKEQSGEKTFWDFSNELDLTGGAHIKDIVPTGSMPVLNGRHKRSGLLSIDLRLERSMQVFIRIAFCIDPLASDDTIESPSFMVTASAGDSISELPILIDLKYPALGFQGDIEMVGNSKVDGYDASHGDRITFLVKVVNLGSIYASDVVVQLAVDGRKVSNVTLPRVGIGSGEEKVVMLTWEASSGEHEVKISIDPDGSILQLGPGDGELSGPITKEVSVKGEGFFGRLESISPVISIIIGILLPIIIASAAVAIVNRKKQK